MVVFPQQSLHDRFSSSIFTNQQLFGTNHIQHYRTRALCRIKLLSVTHVLVDTWMLTVKPVYKLLNVSDDLKWTTNTRDTIFTHFQGITNNFYGFGRAILLFFFYPSTHIPSIFVFTRPNDGWTGLYIKLSNITFSMFNITSLPSSMHHVDSSILISLCVSPSITGGFPLRPTFKC